jgi:hypothetical protein
MPLNEAGHQDDDVTQDREGKLIYRVNRYLFPVSTHALEFDNTVDEGEKGVILAATDIIAGMDRSAVLAVNDAAGLYRFAAVFLATKPLAG